MSALKYPALPSFESKIPASYWRQVLCVDLNKNLTRKEKCINKTSEEIEFIEDVEKLRHCFASIESLKKEQSHDKTSKFLVELIKYLDSSQIKVFNDIEKNVIPILCWLFEVFDNEKYVGERDHSINQIKQRRSLPYIFIDRCLENLKSRNHLLRFKNSDFSNLKFNDINLQDSILIRPNFKNSRIKDLNFSNSIIVSPDFKNYGFFKRSDFSGSNFSGSIIFSGEFEKCNFRDINFTNTVFVGCNFSNVSFKESKFYNTKMIGVNLIDCDFEGAYFSQGEYAGVKIKYAEFKNADLVGSPMKEILEEQDLVSFNELVRYG